MKEMENSPSKRFLLKNVPQSNNVFINGSKYVVWCDILQETILVILHPEKLENRNV